MGLVMDSPKQRSWRRRALIIGLLITLLPTAVFFIYGLFRTPGAFLTSENYMDRPIYSFWVNDFWGGNLAAMSSGGIMCCRKISGSEIKVVWILSTTGEQARAGMKEERHEVILPMPRRHADDRYMHVRFDPGNKVRLGWSPDQYSPFEVRPAKPNMQGGKP